MEQWKHITQDLKADIKVLDMPLLDTTKSGESLDSRFVADLVIQILSYVANKERDNTRSRQRQGIDIMPIVNGKRISVRLVDRLEGLQQNTLHYGIRCIKTGKMA